MPLPELMTQPNPAPVVQVNDNTDALELWHGPTSAFKDMALQILPLLLTKAIAKTGEQQKIVILTATSGDTGKAALEGFADVDGTEIIVFYPESGVSDIQKQQMVTQTGKNVHVFAVKGNFDDAQTGVKQIFANDALNEEIAAQGCALSSANSINWGRLVPQIVYYFSAYSDAVAAGRIKAGDEINFAVPTAIMYLPISLTPAFMTNAVNLKRPFRRLWIYWFPAIWNACCTA